MTQKTLVVSHATLLGVWWLVYLSSPRHNLLYQQPGMSWRQIWNANFAVMSCLCQQRGCKPFKYTSRNVRQNNRQSNVYQAHTWVMTGSTTIVETKSSKLMQSSKWIKHKTGGNQSREDQGEWLCPCRLLLGNGSAVEHACSLCSNQLYLHQDNCFTFLHTEKQAEHLLLLTASCHNGT